MTVGGGWSRHSGGPTGRLDAAAAAATAMDRWVDWTVERVHVNSGSDDKIACARQRDTSCL